METNTILPILQKIPIFADLNEQEHKDIISRIVMNYYPAGHVFFREGDAGDAGMVIIKRGMVKISRKDKTTGEDKEITVLNDNDFFGEMALVLNEPRNATALSVTECEVFELKKEDFTKLTETSPVMANKISTKFIEREKQNQKNV